MLTIAPVCARVAQSSGWISSMDESPVTGLDPIVVAFSYIGEQWWRTLEHKTPGDWLRKASAMPSADEQWVRDLRYAMMLEIEALIDREDFRRPLSKSQVEAMSTPDRLAYRFSRCVDMLDMIAPIENRNPGNSARLALDFAEYLQARHKDPGCEPPPSLMGELLSMDLGR